MIQYILTDEELASYSDDTVRAEVRTRVATMHPDEPAISIVDKDGWQWDHVSGASPTEPSEVIPDTAEELEAKERESFQVQEEAARLESVVRPLVMGRLRAEARGEVREQLREGANAKLELQALKVTSAKQEEKIQTLASQLAEKNQ